MTIKLSRGVIRDIEQHIEKGLTSEITALPDGGIFVKAFPSNRNDIDLTFPLLVSPDGRTEIKIMRAAEDGWQTLYEAMVDQGYWLLGLKGTKGAPPNPGESS